MLQQSFLKVPGAAGALVLTDAVSNNNTPTDPADDQRGRVGLDGSEKVTVAVGPMTDGDGFVSFPFASGNDEAYALVLLPEGRIALAGRTLGSSNYAAGIAVVNPDGSLATSFSNDGIATSPSVSQFNAVTFAGNALFAVGEASQGNYLDIAIAKFDLSGNPASGFGTNGVVVIPVTVGNGHDGANAVAVQADGSIVVGGYSTAADRLTETTLVRVSANGLLDSSFGNQGKVVLSLGPTHDHVKSIDLLSNGSMIVGSMDYNNDSKLVLLKVTQTGALDTSFGSAGKLVTSIYPGSARDSVALQGDKIIVSGGSSGGSSSNFRIARFNADGAVDTSFGTAGVVNFNDESTVASGGVAVQPDGKIVVVGNTRTYRAELNDPVSYTHLRAHET